MKNIETRIGDISNSYLTARTTENIVFNLEPDLAPFGHADRLLMINTALYGFMSSGARLQSRLLDALIVLGFVPSMGGYNICRRNEGN